MPKTPDITIAVPTYRREAVLVETIQALFKQSHKNFELLVVDQTESHGPETTAALLAIDDERFRHVRVSPASVTAAKNFALQAAMAPLILFLDDDIVPHKDLVKYHLQAFKENTSLSAVAGRVMQDGFPVKKEVLKFDEYAMPHGVFTATKADFTNAFPGGNCSLRVSDALKVSGFDTRYYANAFREENDMSLKMSRAGMKIYYEPRAEILHLATPSGGSRAKTYKELYDTAMFYRNEIFFTLRGVARGKRTEALRRKYREYCLSVRHARAYKRRLLFYCGLVAAVWRQAFGRQTVAREISA